MNINSYYWDLLIFFMLILAADSFDFHKIEDEICSFPTEHCSIETQKNSKKSTTEHLTHRLQDGIITFRHFLITDLHRFGEFFSKSLRNCHLDLDVMFTNTYGSFYKENTDIFNELFDRVRSFASSYSENTMKNIVEIFFNQLFRVMFRLTNPFYSLTEEKMKCMEQYAEEIKVFEDIPHKIINQLTMPLTNWRHFLAAVESIHNILDGYLNITLKEECQRAITKMDTCARCRGITEKPCYGFCINVLSGCTFQLQESENTWKLTSETLVKFANQLNKHQNLVSAFQPIPILISEAVMHFQEKRDFITNKMISKCLYDEDYTENTAYRHKRSESDYKKHRALAIHGSTNSMDHLILNQMFEAFIFKVEEFQTFFGNTPELLCESEHWGTKDRDYCWNGTAIGAYKLPIVNKSHPFRNAEFQDENFLTFRGNYVEERLRLQWLQSRISNVITSKHGNDLVRTPQPFVSNDDEDYSDENDEGSGNIQQQNGFEMPHLSRERIEIVIEPYAISTTNSLKISIVFVYLILQVF